MSKSMPIKVSHIAADIAVDNLDDPAWAKASEVSIDTYWSGVAAPAGLL